MPYFDKFDICEAYYQIEVDYNDGGWLHERESNQKRMEATHIQLDRMKFRVGMGWKGYDSLSENGKEIYHLLRERYRFDKWDSWKLDENGEWFDSELEEEEENK